MVAGEVAAVRFVSVRRRGVQRTLAVLGAGPRAEYRRLVAAASPAVEAALTDRVFANRVARSSTHPPRLDLRPWRLERRLFARGLVGLASSHRTLAFADVQDCYASIGPSLVRARLERVGAPSGAEVAAFLSGLASAGIRGLPVGPDPSAVLANAVLAHVDRALEIRGIRFLRWVDDVVIGAHDPREARNGLAVVRQALRELGLRANEAKTRVVIDPSTIAAAGVLSDGAERSGRVG